MPSPPRQLPLPHTASSGAGQTTKHAAEGNDSGRWHVVWDLGSLRIASGEGTASYALRNLRYWFMAQLLRREHVRRQRPLSVLEVGVGHGQMLSHTASSCGQPRSRPWWIHTWDAADRHIHPDLKGLGYQRCIEMNVECDAAPVSHSYDVVILLHLLEHLNDPEAALTRLVSLVKPGGMIIGGGPTLPDRLRPIRERQLRKRAQPYGHVSVISGKRIRQMARHCCLQVEFLTGGYFMRATGGMLERSPLWTRFNLLFGACCPTGPASTTGSCARAAGQRPHSVR